MSERGSNVANFPGSERRLLGHLTPVAKYEPRRVTWLSQGRLAAGKITILDGDPGLGKSTMALDWAARISRGDALPQGPKNPPRGVVILSAEDDPRDTIRPRLDATGADLNKIHIFDMRPEGLVSDEMEARLPIIPEDIEALGHQIEAANAALVIIDPLMAFFSDTVKSNSDQDVRRALSPLSAALQRTGAACLILRHLNKAQGLSTLYRGGGSIGIIGAARFGLIVGRDPDDDTSDRRILAVQKCNIGREQPSLVYRLEEEPGTDVAKVVWEGESEHRASALTGTGKSEEERAGVKEAADWLVATLAGGSVPAGELKRRAEADGLKWRTLEAAKKNARVISDKVGYGRDAPWVWRLAPDQESA
jgi:hypothetical protein